jgi:hypothetical protein
MGGMFWDGRATGWILGDPLAEQAKGPFLNPVEQALPDTQTLCWSVNQSNYAKLFRQVWGPFNCNDSVDVSTVYDQIGYSISAYEKSYEVNPINSKFDGFWDNAKDAGMDVTEIDMDKYVDYIALALAACAIRALQPAVSILSTIQYQLPILSKATGVPLGNILSKSRIAPD